MKPVTEDRHEQVAISSEKAPNSQRMASTVQKEYANDMRICPELTLITIGVSSNVLYIFVVLSQMTHRVMEAMGFKNALTTKVIWEV